MLLNLLNLKNSIPKPSGAVNACPVRFANPNDNVLKEKQGCRWQSLSFSYFFFSFLSLVRTATCAATTITCSSERCKVGKREEKNNKWWQARLSLKQKYNRTFNLPTSEIPDEPNCLQIEDNDVIKPHVGVNPCLFPVHMPYINSLQMRLQRTFYCFNNAKFGSTFAYSRVQKWRVRLPHTLRFWRIHVCNSLQTCQYFSPNTFVGRLTV